MESFWLLRCPLECFENEEQEKEEEEKEEEEEEEEKERGLNEEKVSFGLGRERKGIEDIEEVDMDNGSGRSSGIRRRKSGGFRRAFEEGRQMRGGKRVKDEMIE